MTSKVISGLEAYQAPRLKKSTRIASRVDAGHKYNAYTGGASPPPSEVVIPTFQSALQSNLDAKYFGSEVIAGGFGRASDGTYVDVNGNRQIVGPSIPRFEYASGSLLGLLMENDEENYFLNSTAPVTQNITLATSVYTLAVYGTGSVTSADAGGTASGHGVATEGNSLFLTVSVAGDFSFTVSGTPDIVQLENWYVPTSPIVSTDAIGIRAREYLNWPIVDSQGRNVINDPEGMAAIVWRPGFSDSNVPTGSTRTTSIMRLTFNLANGEFFYFQRNATGENLFVNSDGTNFSTIQIAGGVVADSEYVIALRWAGNQKQIGYKVGGSWAWSVAGSMNSSFTKESQIRLASRQGTTFNSAAHHRFLTFWQEDKGTTWIENYFAGFAN